MAGNTKTTLSEQIYKSRDEIRNQIIEYMKTYLELENVDLTKSNFLSFVVNTLSTLTSNLMFYQSSVYKEFFLTSAQLDESVYGLASFLGYEIKQASYASTDILFTVPLAFESNHVEFTIPEGFTAQAGNIPFVTDYRTDVTIDNNSSVQVQVTEENRRYNLPVNIDTTANEFYFLLNVKQYQNNVQEFQIDEDIQPFQFINIDVPLNGQPSNIQVEVKNPDSPAFELYTEYPSLYLMSNDEKGFVTRRISDGIRIYFGNGLMGFQPLPNSTVRVTVQETLGSEGNAIPGSITKGERIYTQSDEGRQILSYSIVNTTAAFGGKDEESTEEIRSNAIAGLRTTNKLVSSGDYNDMYSIINVPRSTIIDTFPVLKRSDLKVNEIQVFCAIQYSSKQYDVHLVPTRNEHLETDTEYIPRGTIIESAGIQFLTVLDIFIDPLNKAASYEYVIYSASYTPILIRTYELTYDFIANELKVYNYYGKGIFELHYTSEEPDYDSLTCEITIRNYNVKYPMINDFANKRFVLEIDPYTDIPEGQLDCQFTITSISGTVSTYEATVTFRKDLSSIMQSNVTIDQITGKYTVYDVPVVRAAYYQAIDKENFELQVIQNVLNGLGLEDKRMLTDFPNMKFTNTVGYLSNMLYNTAQSSAIDMVSELPTDATEAQTYILLSTNQLATLVDSDTQTWSFSTPVTDSMIYVTNLGEKLIYSESGWIKPIYQIPLIIEVEVFTISGFAGSIEGLTSQIKSNLINEFSDRFGSNASIYRSEIIDVIHNLTDVSHCRVLRPESNIFFDFNIERFSQDQLLKYSPEYVHFTEESIVVHIYQ